MAYQTPRRNHRGTFTSSESVMHRAGYGLQCAEARIHFPGMPRLVRPTENQKPVRGTGSAGLDAHGLPVRGLYPGGILDRDSKSE